MPWRWITSSRGVILMFHRVVSEYPQREFCPTNQFSLTPDRLATVIRSLRDAALEIVTLDEAHRRLTSGKTERPFASLTFDDGYRDNFELAYPVCAHLDAPMTAYITTGFVDRTAPIWWYGLESVISGQETVHVRVDDVDTEYPTRTVSEKFAAYRSIAQIVRQAGRDVRNRLLEEIDRRYGVDFAGMSATLAMDWQMLKEFDRQPGVEIGAHTVSHPALCSLSDDEARHEIAESRRLLEEVLEHPVRHFAYPYGDSTTIGGRETRLCREMGFTTATTVRHGLLTAKHSFALHNLPRIPTDPFETAQTVAVKLSGISSALQIFRRG